MSLRFYTDTHIAKQVAIQLREQGIEVIRCEEIGLAEASDEEHLEYAARDNRVMVTKDNDFPRIHARWQAEGRHHAGIFFCPYRDIPAIGLLVTVCAEMVEMVTGGAADIEQDIADQVKYIT